MNRVHYLLHGISVGLDEWNRMLLFVLFDVGLDTPGAERQTAGGTGTEVLYGLVLVVEAGGSLWGFIHNEFINKYLMDDHLRKSHILSHRFSVLS